MSTDAKAPFDDIDADVIIRSSDSVDFRAFKVFLSKTSSFFDDMFKLPQGASNHDQEMRGDLPVITVVEKSSVVKHMLQCCYPISFVGELSLETVDDIIDLWEAAQKYQMTRVATLARYALVKPTVLEKYAFKIYAFAVAQRWEHEARTAARQLLREAPPWTNSYSTEIESITGGDFHRFQRYFIKCSEAAKSVSKRSKWPKLRHEFQGIECSNCRQMDKTVTIGKYIYHPNRWWAEYLSKVGESLARKPCGKSVLESAIIEETLQLQGQCQSCLSRGASVLAADLHKFAKDLAADIDQAISEVGFTFVDSRQVYHPTHDMIYHRLYWRCVFEQQGRREYVGWNAQNITPSFGTS